MEKNKDERARAKPSRYIARNFYISLDYAQFSRVLKIKDCLILSTFFIFIKMRFAD